MMKSVIRFLLGMFTIYPLGYMLLGVTFILRILRERQVNEQYLDKIFTVHLVTMGIVTILMIFYLIHLYQNNRLVGNSKMGWTLAFIFGSFVAMPIYWWRYIYRYR